LKAILIFACFFSLFSFGQIEHEYLFNGKKDSVLYADFQNIFFTKNGFPINLDGAFDVQNADNFQTFQINTLDTVTRTKAMLWIVRYEQNPVTDEREKVIIDKFEVQIKPAPRKILMWGKVASGEVLDTASLDFSILLDNPELKQNLQILEVNLTFNGENLKIRGAKISDSQKAKILSLPESTKISVTLTYNDGRTRNRFIEGYFFR